MDRMLQSASFGVQMFDSFGNQPAMPSEIRPPGNREVEEIREGTNGTTKRQVAIPSFSFRQYHQRS